jgi:hypothetical protein
MTYVFDVPDIKPKHRTFNAQLIPKKLQELSLAGIYHDSKLLP